MSNQVYRNEQHKYLDTRSLYLRTLGSDVTVPSTLENQINFANSNASVYDEYYSVNLAGSITFLKEGIYSINVLFELVDVNDPQNNDIDFRVRIFAVNEVTDVSMLEERIVARGVDLGSDVRHVTLSFTGYFNIDDSIRIFCMNNAGQNLKILNANSLLTICKIY